MARYNTFKYGDGTHYGTSAVTEAGALTWIFLVDWDGDGVYDGANEAAWCKHFSMNRGREEYLSLEGNGLEHMRPDTATLVMDDPARRYDPRNGGSDLSPNVYPGKKCQIAVLDNSTDPRTRSTRFTGYIDSISPITDSDEVTITCKGNLQPLADLELSTSAAHINTTIHDAFVNLLNEAGYTGGIAIDACTQPVVNFAVDGMSAAQVAGQLADAALGQFFVDVEGKAKFYSRNHNYAPGALPDIGEAQILKEIKISQPWDGVFKIVDVLCRKQVREQPSIVYYLSNPIEFSGSPLVVDLYPSFQSSSDVASGTLEANTQADGKGTNIKTSVTCTVFDVGPTGGHIKLQSSTAGFITQLEIRGCKWREVVEKFNHTATPSPYDRKFTLDTPWLQDRNFAQSFKDTLWAFLDDDRESLIIQIEGRPSVQFVHDLLTKIHFTGATYSLHDDYWIIGISEEWLNDTGQLARTTFYMSKIYNDSTSITSANIEEELPAPLGLDNPAGDPDTQMATGTGMGASKICCGKVDESGTAALPSGSMTVYGVISTIIENPDNMLELDSKTITIPENGYYAVDITGYTCLKYPFSSDDDDAGKKWNTANITLVCTNGPIVYGGGRLGKPYSPNTDWIGRICVTLSAILEFSANQEIYIGVGANTGILTGTMDYHHYYWISIQKVREVT